MKNIILLLFILFAQFALGLEGKVVGVHDGDTITILDPSMTQHKIRLAQIDAPELGQDWGRNSKKALSDLIFNRDVRVEVETIDRYGRKVGTVYFHKLDICKEQIRSGYAWVYTKYLQDRSLISLEHTAKVNRIGLWSASDATPPWLWRKAKSDNHHR